MSYMGALVTFVMIAGCLGIVGYVTYCYLTAPLTMTVNTLDPKSPSITRPSTIMDKLAYATKKSASLFWQLATGFTLMLGNAIFNMSDFFGAPEVRMWVTEHLSIEAASTVLCVFVGINVWARVRNAMGA